MDAHQLFQRHIEQQFFSSLGGAYAHAGATSASTLTLEKIEAAVEQVEAMEEAPFKNLLRDKGFNPEKDMIVFSKKAADLAGFAKEKIPRRMRDRVKISEYLDDGVGCYLIKSPESVGIFAPYVLREV